ncbi:MipA/OmpV family protein [Cedecea sp.]|jgi:outer membrane scaffolding protein for murein synthesis (MipA/OmpV family)|uniref:MipA/OmpV family protein n=1 Tax=Cedecea sp. TaxID=1970739 RepID=UPI0012ADE3C8|nr:MipA/OmpV family protein [Enterobacteriaceae bacterium RIT693]
MLTKKSTTYIIAPLLISGISSAYASEFNPDETAITFGPGAISSPRYSGANEQSTGIIPLIHIQKRNIFLDSINGLGIHLQSDNGLYFEPTLGYDSGRTDKNSGWRKGSDKLKGMGDISSTVNSGIAIGWAVARWLVFEGKTTLPLNEGQGVSYSTSIDYIPIMNEDNSITLQASALFGDARYMNTWYGVSNQQHVRSGFARYSSAGGFYGTDTSLTLTHQFSEHWGAGFSLSYAWLNKNVANSPIVMRRDGTTGTLAVNYTF